jgi:hypothetical protein
VVPAELAQIDQLKCISRIFNYFKKL